MRACPERAGRSYASALSRGRSAGRARERPLQRFDMEEPMITRPAFFVLVAMIGCHRETAPPTAPLPPVAGVPGQAVAPEQLVRGEYIATISGCVICHTPMKAGAVDRER